MAKNKKPSTEAVDQIFDDLFPINSAPPVSRNEAALLVNIGKVILARRDDLELWEEDPRKSRTREQVEEMADSLRNDGQDEPLIGRPHPDPEKRAVGKIQIICGGTRWEASAPELADLPQLKVELRSLDDKEAFRLAWRNNTKRNQHTALDHAYYFKKRLTQEGGEGNPDSYRLVATEEGFSHTRIGQFVRLLNLPPDVLDTFARNRLEEKHGRALLVLNDHHEAQQKLLDDILADRLTGTAAHDKAVARRDALEGREPKEPKPKKEKKETEPSPPASDNTPSLFDESSPTSATEPGNTLAGNSDDAELPPEDDWHSKLRAQKAGVNGVGSSAPSGSGSGFAISSEGGQNLKGAKGQTGITVKVKDSKPTQVETSNVVDDLAVIQRYLFDNAPVKNPAFLASIESSLDDLQIAINGAREAVSFNRAAAKANLQPKEAES